MTHPALSAALALALTLSAAPALSQASGDGFQGPRLFGDSALDQSLAALNREMALSYARKDLLADVITPDMATLAASARAVSQLDDDSPMGSPATAGFEGDVLGDGGLDAALARLTDRLRDRDTLLFIAVTRSASGDLHERFNENPDDISLFGPQITGDGTLNAKMVHVFDLVGADKADAIAEAAPVPAFSDAALNSIVTAYAAPPTEL